MININSTDNPRMTKTNGLVERVCSSKSSINRGKDKFAHCLTGSISYPFIIVFFVLVSCVESSKHERLVGTGNSSDTVQFPKPDWLDKEPLVIVGNWDDALIFQRRRGGEPEWIEDDYKRGHSEETVKKLKELGVTMAVIHFYKGFGLEAEKEQLEDAKKLSQLCKKHGIRVGVYVGSTIAHETFLAEEPGAAEWFAPDYLGEPVHYPGTQTYRKRAYFMHPGYIEYTKRVIRIAIEDLDVDIIHFDNTSNRAEPPIFHHPMAIEDFRTYLKNKYSPEILRMRLGHTHVEFIEPPKWKEPLSVIRDPMFQEWTDFRCDQLACFYGIMDEYIRNLNPDVAIDNNPHLGMSGTNTMWEQGTDYPKLLKHTDIIWTEEGNSPNINEDGTLVSKIRTYKMASILKNKVFTYTFHHPLEMAEAMAFNRQCIGMVGWILADDYLPAKQREYIQFYHKNFEYYRDIENIADVAVLHSYATMAYNNDRPYQSSFLFEQALIQEKIPFDIVFDQNLKDLSKYKVLVLADQKCLSDENLEYIKSFVKQGGAIIATEHTSFYNEWMKMKRRPGLHELLNLGLQDWIQWEHNYRSEPILETGIVKNKYGEGKVVYIPEIIPGNPKPRAGAMSSRYWKLPLNLDEIIESVKWASDNDLAVEINAPQTIATELYRRTDNGQLVLHLINYNNKRQQLINDIAVKLRIPEGRSVSEVKVLSPDNGIVEYLDFTQYGNRIDLVVPQLEAYSVVVVV